jgi:hypothetical protein
MLNMFCRDLFERDWISAVHEMSCWINVLVWGIVMHSVTSVAAFQDSCTRHFLLFSYGFTFAYLRQDNRAEVPSPKSRKSFLSVTESGALC